MAEHVTVEGLTEFRKGLRAANKALPKALTRAHKRIATTVVDAAKPLARTKNGKATRSSSTIRGSGTQNGAFIRASGPTAYGDEYGSVTHSQFRPWRGNTTGAGYAIWPAIRAQKTQIEDTLLDEVVAELEKEAFPD